MQNLLKYLCTGERIDLAPSHPKNEPPARMLMRVFRPGRIDEHVRVDKDQGSSSEGSGTDWRFMVSTSSTGNEKRPRASAARIRSVIDEVPYCALQADQPSE